MMQKDNASQRGQKIAKKLDDIEHIIKGLEAKPKDPFDEIVPPSTQPCSPPKKDKGGA